MHMHIHLSAISGWNCKLENRTTRKKTEQGRGPITNTGAKGGLLSFGKTCGGGCRVDHQPLFGKWAPAPPPSNRREARERRKSSLRRRHVSDIIPCH